MKVVVLAGGLSPERDVSFSSGTMIANALKKNGHEVMILDLYLGTKNMHFLPVYRTNQDENYQYSIPSAEPDLDQIRKEAGNQRRMIGEGVIEYCQQADKVFLALHGSVGENGQLQALLDMYQIPYTGSGYQGSALAMDKHIAKMLMKAANIPTPDWYIVDFSKSKTHQNTKNFRQAVVKPCSCGSSVGVVLVNDQQELEEALFNAKKYENRIMVEERIKGREFSVGVLDGQPLPVIEIIPKQGFYDYTNKYQVGLTTEICPANLSSKETQMIQTLAKEVHELLQLGYYSRIDFLYKGDTFYCLEANTLPGMTPTSLLPQEANVLGIDYQALCDLLLKN